MIEFVSQVDDSVLAFFALECIEKWMIKRKKAELLYDLPPYGFHVLKEVLVNVIQITRRSYNNKLLDRAWIILKQSQGKEKVSSFAYIARLHAHASLGNLEKAFGTLKALESSYGDSSQEDAHLFSPFSALYPLVKIFAERMKMAKHPKFIMPVVFVSFKTRWDAVVCAQTQQSRNPIVWLTEWAPEPRDVYWDNLAIPFASLTI